MTIYIVTTMSHTPTNAGASLLRACSFCGLDRADAAQSSGPGIARADGSNDLEDESVDTMKAVRIHSYGGKEVLSYEDAPCPNAGADEVLVRVFAAGVNPVDWKIREGLLKEKLQHKFPLIPGWDLSGIVEEAGAGVKRFKPGDEVFSRPDISRDGAYAEFIVVEESLLAKKPRTVDHIHAAGIPLAAMTAWQALFDAAQVRRNQRVLIHAGAGGVGSFAVQFAKWKGAHVIATCSTGNVDFVRSLGADEVIDYRQADFTHMRRVDAALDTLGGEVQERSWRVVKPFGVLVSIVSPPPRETAESLNIRPAFVSTKSDGVLLAGIAKLVDGGKIKSAVETVLPLAEAWHAQELSMSGHARGKIVLQVSPAC
jgi:NADPH:quinone reductase-like Zn-dependent oxidoreductase